MTTDRFRQTGFACDPAGAIILVGDRVRLSCATCGQPVEADFPVARAFKTGSIAVFDATHKQRHVRGGRFTLSAKETS